MNDIIGLWSVQATPLLFYGHATGIYNIDGLVSFVHSMSHSRRDDTVNLHYPQYGDYQMMYQLGVG